MPESGEAPSAAPDPAPASETAQSRLVSILSSLSAPEERRRGLDAGADACLVKGEMDGEILSATLERLCGGAP